MISVKTCYQWTGKNWVEVTSLLAHKHRKTHKWICQIPVVLGMDTCSGKPDVMLLIASIQTSLAIKNIPSDNKIMWQFITYAVCRQAILLCTCLHCCISARPIHCVHHLPKDPDKKTSAKLKIQHLNSSSSIIIQCPLQMVSKKLFSHIVMKAFSFAR